VPDKVKVTYHVFRDVHLDSAAASDEEAMEKTDPRRAAQVRRDRYSFVAIRHHPGRGKLFLGTTNRAGDILVQFDLRSGRFTSCGFARSGFCSPHHAKIHKGITLDESRDRLYFGTATLSPLRSTITTPGGSLLGYDLGTRRFTRLAMPTPGHYYQATHFDLVRKLVYLCSDRGCFGVYDLSRKRLKRFEVMESIPHNIAVDDRGGAWGTHSPGRHAFFRYDPDRDEFAMPDGCAFPDAPKAANIMYPGAGPTDCIINGGDGYLYAASALGDVCRIDPQSFEVRYLGRPFPGIRLPAMGLGPDGWIYLCGGRDGASQLARYSRRDGRFEALGHVRHPDGKYLHYAHELCVVDDVVYIGETDNPLRSGYLWACRV
jgi:hypothetical protein